MKTINLFPKNGKFYKACLHTHSFVSDGEFSPLEVKKMYKDNGYGIVAFTDHEVLVAHNELDDENFIALTSYELSINENRVERLFPYEKCYHFNAISKIKDNEISPVFTEKEIWLEHSKKFVNPKQFEVDYNLKFDMNTVNDLVEKLNENNFLVALNHPEWSLLDYHDYADINGLWGIEVYGHGGEIDGISETVRPFEDLINQSKNVYPLATDDMHHLNEAFGGFVMVKVPSLTYDNVIKGLENGDFYSSEGPEIYSLILEDYKLKISCSPCVRIAISTQMRKNQAVQGSNLESAEFDIKEYFDLYEDALKHTGKETYFRLTFTDKNGKRAYTKAYFIKDLINKLQ